LKADYQASAEEIAGIDCGVDDAERNRGGSQGGVRQIPPRIKVVFTAAALEDAAVPCIYRRDSELRGVKLPRRPQPRVAFVEPRLAQCVFA
jgi:hypothetical protein